MIVEPLLAGADQVNVSVAFPAVSVATAGVDGTVFGLNGPISADSAPSPRALTAFILILYNVPLVNPVIVKDVPDVQLDVWYSP